MSSRHSQRETRSSRGNWRAPCTAPRFFPRRRLRCVSRSEKWPTRYCSPASASNRRFSRGSATRSGTRICLPRSLAFLPPHKPHLQLLHNCEHNDEEIAPEPCQMLAWPTVQELKESRKRQRQREGSERKVG